MAMITTTYDEMIEAYKLASASLDNSTQNAAFVFSDVSRITVGSSGNLAFEAKSVVGATNQISFLLESNPERFERPLKNIYVEHAERSAIYRAASLGISTAGGIMVSPWAACVECSRAIIHSGIKHLVVHQPMIDATPDRWKEQVELGHELLLEAGVQIHRYDGKLSSVKPILFNGKPFQP